jgi:hypothetical protein
MKKLLLILLCLPMIGFGQGWEETFGGIGDDFGKSVQQTIDGGYIITGTTESFGNGTQSVYLIKTDENGIEQWSQTFEGTDDQWGNTVQQTSDEGYVIIGGAESFGAGERDVYLIKTDANGDSLWTKTIGGAGQDEGKSVQQTTDGGYIISGDTQSSGNGGEDVYLIKTDSNGVEQWNNTFGGTDNDGSFSVQQTIDGGYIIAGYTFSFGNGSVDVYLIKTDENGLEQWSQTFGGTDEDWSWSSQQTADGGYIISGETESFGNGGIDVYLIKTNSNGVEQWSNTFGGLNNDGGCYEASFARQTIDGGYIITGYTESFGAGQKDGYLIKTDANGVEEWNKTFGGSGDDQACSVQQTTDGGYVVIGGTESFGTSNNQDVYLIKTDANGNATSTFNIPINPNRKLQKTVDILGKETKPKTNTPLIEIYDDGTVEKRIVIE